MRTATGDFQLSEPFYIDDSGKTSNRVVSPVHDRFAPYELGQRSLSCRAKLSVEEPRFTDVFWVCGTPRSGMLTWPVATCLGALAQGADVDDAVPALALEARLDASTASDGAESFSSIPRILATQLWSVSGVRSSARSGGSRCDIY